MIQYFNFPLLYDGDHQDEVFVNMSVFNSDLGNYFISNYGRVYSWISRRFLKPQMHNGYHYIALGANFRDFIHRLVAFAFVPGYTEERNCVNHKDGKKTNNYYKNLEWCSKAENNQHAYATHLNNCVGENCRSAKLTNCQVHTICGFLQDGFEINEILDLMNMERSMNNYEIIRSIRKGYAWKSISKDYNVGYTDHIRGSISDDEVRAICKCFEDGLSIADTYECIYNKPFLGTDKCDKYNTIRNIRSKKSYRDISKDYNF